MKQIIVKFFIYITALIGIHLFAAYQADGKFDPYYIRFTNGQHQSMIVGTSRAAQGLNPSVMNEILEDYTAIGNFAFTSENSPYGSVYLEAIRRKVDTTAAYNKKNVFILCVSPWSIMTFNNETDDTSKFREQHLFLAKIKSVDKKGKPNFEYLTKEYTQSWGKILYNPVDNHAFLHDNGWLEIRVPMDSLSLQKRIAEKVADYNNLSRVSRFSPNRIQYLEQTIQFLKKYGSIYLVRLPTSESIADIENKLMPEFDDKMIGLSKKYDAQYWSFFTENADYEYTDGNHLYYQSSLKVSKKLANMIEHQK